jgi:hypothetical protein
MTMDELIESLPGDLQPWARLWIPVLARWSERAVAEFIMNAAGMPWDAAYAMLVESMTIDEKIAELQLRKKTLAQLNIENENHINNQRALFFSVLAKLIKFQI